jgi:hypothetical protein
VHGEGVQGIVLEDRQQATGTGRPVEFAKPCHVLVVRDVMEHAGREGQVEPAFVDRDPVSGDLHELRLALETALQDRETTAGHVGAGQARLREIVAEMRDGVADARSKIEDACDGKAPGLRQIPQRLDLVAGEKIGLLARDSHVFAVLVVILVGKPVELCASHGSDLPSFAPSSVEVVRHLPALDPWIAQLASPSKLELCH